MARANVLLMVTGGIAAYKSCLLTRLLTQAGFSVRVAMTDAAQHFVGPVTFRALTGHGVATDLWGEGDTDPLDHVELARWADLVVVAPATANLLGKAAGGIADDIVTTLLLASERDLVVAPAMNDAMWRHPATAANLEILAGRGAHVVEPGVGWLACGVEAEGRMASPEEILARVEDLCVNHAAGGGEPASGILSGRRVLVTAGPTREPFDAIRYLSNRSTGVFGFAIARAAAAAGAGVTLIHGPVSIPVPANLTGCIAVETAAEMATAVTDHLDDKDLLVMAAAVADFSPSRPVEGKLKKESLGTSWRVEMTRTTDILTEVVDRSHWPELKVVGFALETQDLIERAAEKMRAKDLDCIVANDPTAPDGGFGDGRHSVWLLDRDGVRWKGGPADKGVLAVDLVDQLAALLPAEDGT